MVGRTGEIPGLERVVAQVEQPGPRPRDDELPPTVGHRARPLLSLARRGGAGRREGLAVAVAIAATAARCGLAAAEPEESGPPGEDDPDWGRLLAALKEEDLPLWVVLQSRPFLGWREGAALVSDRPGSLSWRQLTSERVATVLSKVGSDALDRPVALRPVEDKGREEIAGRLRDHGLHGEWL